MWQFMYIVVLLLLFWLGPRYAAMAEKAQLGRTNWLISIYLLLAFASPIVSWSILFEVVDYYKMTMIQYDLEGMAELLATFGAIAQVAFFIYGFFLRMDKHKENLQINRPG